MTFEELLDQAIALLQRRGRLTYRALKRQFDLDDDYLEDLKTELIKGQRLAADEDGEVLVWIGDAASPPPPRRTMHGSPRYPTPRGNGSGAWPDKLQTNRNLATRLCHLYAHVTQR